MDIIILAAVDFPAGPASTSRVKNIARILVAGGNRVTVGSLQPNAKTPYPENTSTEGEIEGISFTYLSGKVVRPAGLAGALMDTARGCLGACRLLWTQHRAKGVDLVVFYTPDFFQNLPMILLCKLLRIPTVLEMCEIGSTMRAMNYRQRVRLLSSISTERFLTRWCSGIIAISSNIENFLLSKGIDRRRIYHLPVLVDWKMFASTSIAAIPQLVNKRYFLNSGGLGEKDGYEFLLSGFALFSRQHPDVLLALTGNADAGRRRYVEELVKKFGIENRVVFTGFLSNDQLIWCYQNALALLCCRNKSRFASYGSPTKLSEYLSSARPVITNEVGDTARYLENDKNAFFAQVEDAASIAEQMDKVLISPLKAAEVGKEGQNVARGYFNYENYVVTLNRFLHGLAKEARSGSHVDTANLPH